MELPRWPKTPVDPRLQTTGIVIGSSLAVLKLLADFIIPYYEAFLIFPTLAAAAWYAYSWRKNRNFLTLWWMQYVIVPNIALTSLAAFLYFRQGGGYSLLIGCLDLLAVAAWTALSLRAAYEKHDDVIFFWRQIRDQAHTDKAMLEAIQNCLSIDKKLIDSLSNSLDTTDPNVF